MPQTGGLVDEVNKEIKHILLLKKNPRSCKLTHPRKGVSHEKKN